MAKAQSLIKAYKNEEIPPNGGFIVSGFFDPGSTYAIYEVTAYRNVKDIYQVPEGIVFKTDGNRTHMLVEPPGYHKKYVEPVSREDTKSIPYRFGDLEIIKTKKVERIMIPGEPLMLYSSFTILNTEGGSFSFVFEPTKDVYGALKKFIEDSLYNDCNLSKSDSTQGSTKILETIKKFTIWGT